MKNTIENLKAVVKENESLNAQYKELKAFESKINDMILSIGNPYRNLKVYDISSYLYDLQQKSILTFDEMVNKFNLICEMEYEYFQEEENEMTNLIEREYIGRTSSFKYTANVGDYHHEEIFNGETYEIQDFAYHLPFMESLILFVADHNQEAERYIDDAMDYVQCEIDKAYDPTDDDLHEIVNDSFEGLVQSLYEEVACLEDVHNVMKDIKEVKKYINEWKSERNAIELIEAYK